MVKYKNNPYYKGAELWDNLAMSTIECDNIFDLQVALRKEIGTYLNMYKHIMFELQVTSIT